MWSWKCQWYQDFPCNAVKEFHHKCRQGGFGDQQCSDTETLRCKDVKYPTNDAWLAKNTLRYHEMTSAASHE